MSSFAWATPESFDFTTATLSTNRNDALDFQPVLHNVVGSIL